MLSSLVATTKAKLVQSSQIRRSILDFVRVTNYCIVLYCMYMVQTFTKAPIGHPTLLRFDHVNDAFLSKETLTNRTKNNFCIADQCSVAILQLQL